MILLRYVNEFTVGVGILVFLIVFLRIIIQKKEITLESILLRVFAGSAIPTGLVLILCAFDTSLIAGLTGLNIHIAVAGMALIYLSYKTLFTRDK